MGAISRSSIDLGHAQLVTAAEMATPTRDTFYMPMHGVHKETSSSTKLRVVFDGSASTSTHVSLNDLLYAGPTLHPPLDQILIRFRTFRVALSADVAKMYREIMLHPKDRQLHRFLWRANPEDQVQTYCMNRLTFGITSSPYLAVRTLQQVAADHGAQAPIASYHTVNDRVCSSHQI